jgi:hypothetical protein
MATSTLSIKTVTMTVKKPNIMKARAAAHISQVMATTFGN